MLVSRFKEQRSLEERVKAGRALRFKYPDRIAVICEPGKNADALPLKNCKFLTPGDLTVGQFVYIVRKRLNSLQAHQALFLTCGGTLPRVSESMREVYDREADPEDQMLYINYSLESTFG